MKIENQVCTLEQAKKLKELGVTAEPLFWYVIDIDPITPLDIIQKWQHSNFDQCEKYSAFTVAELGVMLPDGKTIDPEYTQIVTCRSYSDSSLYVCFCERVIGDNEPTIEQFGDTEAEARADMLIYLLENHLTTPEEVNKRLNK